MRRLLALFLTLLVAAAGCISKPTEVEPEDVNETPDGVIGANESTAAPDGRGELSAFKETNRTVVNGTDAMEHKHDYWKGQTRIDIATWDSGLIPIPLIPEGKAPGTAIADYDIPAPSLVYEGTDHLEIIFKDVKVWGTHMVEGAPEHPAITIFVDYLTAADEPGEFHAAGQAKPNEPLIIPVKPTEADMPHQTKSLWVFRIYTGEANSFAYNFTLTAVKGNAVVDWPPHPDLYAEKMERLIHEGPFHGEYAGGADNLLYGTEANWLFPERIISYGTDKVTVTIEKGAWGAAWPEPAADQFILEVNNASYIPLVGNGDAAGHHLEPVSIDGTTYTFDVPVDHQGYDTPYGQHSRWGFRFVPAPQAADPLGIVRADIAWSLDYTIKILATGHSVATESLPS
jgi:hypothetical protein